MCTIVIVMSLTFYAIGVIHYMLGDVPAAAYWVASSAALRVTITEVK